MKDSLKSQLLKLNYQKDIRPCFRISKDKFNMFLAEFRKANPNLSYRQILSGTRNLIDKHYLKIQKENQPYQIESQTMKFKETTYFFKNPLARNYINISANNNFVDKCANYQDITEQLNKSKHGLCKSSAHLVVRWIDGILTDILENSKELN